MSRESRLQEIREELKERNAMRTTFNVHNYVGEARRCTGWLFENLGHNFYRVWSDQHRQYIAVHSSRIVSPRGL